MSATETNRAEPQNRTPSRHARAHGPRASAGASAKPAARTQRTARIRTLPSATAFGVERAVSPRRGRRADRESVRAQRDRSVASLPSSTVEARYLPGFLPRHLLPCSNSRPERLRTTLQHRMHCLVLQSKLACDRSRSDRGKIPCGQAGFALYELTEFVESNRSSYRKGYDHRGAKLRFSCRTTSFQIPALTLKDVRRVVKSRSETAKRMALVSRAGAITGAGPSRHPCHNCGGRALISSRCKVVEQSSRSRRSYRSGWQP
jgi:hypothetical protein